MHLNNFKRMIFVGYFVTALVIGIMFGFIFYNIRATQDVAKSMEKEFKLLNRQQQILIDLQNIENGQRGYFITADTKFLNTFSLGKKLLKIDTVNMSQVLNTVPNRANLYDSLQQLMQNKIAFAEECIRLRNQYGEDSSESFIAQSKGWLLMNQIREKLNDVQQHRLNFIQKLEEKNKKLTKKRIDNFIGLSLILLIIFLLNYLLYRKGFQIQLERERKLNYNTAIVSNLIDPVITADLNYNIISWNHHAYQLFGFTLKEVKGKRIRHVLKTRSLTYTLEEINEIILEEGHFNGDLIYYKQSGEEVFMNVSTSLLRDENNQPYGTVSILRDISKYEKTLVKARMELEFLNERLSLILRSTNEAIWDWDLVSNRIWGNEQYKTLIGADNYNEATNYTTFFSRIHPDYQQNTDFENTIKEKGENLSVELKFLMNSGEWHIFLNRIIILYNDGKPYRVLGTLQDITERKKYEEEIIHEKELSDTLINSLPGIFYMFNKDGKYLRWNKNIEKITGYTTEEMKELHPIVFVPEEQRSMLAEKITNVFNYGIDNAEAGLLTKNQEVIPYYFTGIYINYNGEDCMMGVGIDISERIKIQEELRELATHLQIIREEEQSRIAREIHDELGQQLTGIKMDLSLVSKKIQVSPVEMITKLKEVMLMVDDTMKKVRQIATQLRPSVLDDLGLIAAMEWQSDEFQKRFDIKTEFITAHTSLSIPSEMATALFRIYQESLTNVLRHAAATQVNTVLSVDDNKLILEITDNGKGFDIIELENKKTLGITGIRERVIMLDGVFDIKSQKGKGTCLTIEVPLIS